MPTEKTVNYTDAMVATLLKNVPFDHAKAKAFASVLDRNPQSIVAKLKRLEADETIKGDRPFYNAKEAYVPKTGKPVEKKSEIVTTLEVLLGVEVKHFKGLDKAPKGSLEKVREAYTAIINDLDKLGDLYGELELRLEEKAQAEIEAEDAADNVVETNDETEASVSSDEG